MERERAEEIDHDNYTLLKKMQQIMKTEGSVDHRNTYKHHRCGYASEIAYHVHAATLVAVTVNCSCQVANKYCTNVIMVQLYRP